MRCIQFSLIILLRVFAMHCCSPTFSQRSDNQTEAKWPAPFGINESYATEGCRAIIVNTTFIGQSCVDSLSNQSSSNDIVQACINDVQVLITAKLLSVR